MDNDHQDLLAKNIRLCRRIIELETVLRKIVDLRYSNSSAAAVAQSALDTMRELDKPMPHDPDFSYTGMDKP